MVYNKEYYQTHKALFAESQRKYRLSHPEKFKAYRQTDKYKQLQKQWKTNHPDYQKQWLEQHSNYQREWSQSHPGYNLKYYLKWKNSSQYITFQKRNKLRGRLVNKSLKLELISHYSNGKMKCAKCGFDNIHALQLDHINGGGTQHRKIAVGSRSGHKFYQYLKDNNYPDGLQVLCANCNWIKRYENNENYRSQ